MYRILCGKVFFLLKHYHCVHSHLSGASSWGLGYVWLCCIYWEMQSLTVLESMALLASDLRCTVHIQTLQHHNLRTKCFFILTKDLFVCNLFSLHFQWLEILESAVWHNIFRPTMKCKPQFSGLFNILVQALYSLSRMDEVTAPKYI